MSVQPSPVPLRTFWTDLPREGRLLLSVVAFQFIGTGLVLPFWVVYLHEIRGFSLDTVGLLMALLSLAGVVVVGPGGVVIDRIGARKTMIGSLMMAFSGQIVMAFAETIPVAVVGLSLVGASFGLSWPASQSMVATIVPSAIRPRYFGMNFALLNLGVGIGGIIGGLVADVDRPVTFQTMYLVEAASYLPATLLLLGPLRHAGGPHRRELSEVEEQADAGGVGYLALLRRPGVLPLTLLSFVAAFIGYAQLNSGMPAYARAVSEVSTRALGWAFAANTLVIVLLQLLVLRRVDGHRRTRVVVVMAVMWAVSWMLLGATSWIPGTVGATLLVAGCASVFALGETLLQPTVPAMVNDLAPDHLRGRYNALNSAAFQAASVTGPPVAGLLIGRGLGDVWIGLLLAGVLLEIAVAVLWVEPQLPDVANGVREPTRQAS
ncbi:MFS transporter [Aeromicrobium panaciterrae]|uniref:MFS transporter n=1 Tax=Aeromicrobium panaciterrae TaxID=363861 RepID=UPI0031D027BE